MRHDRKEKKGDKQNRDQSKTKESKECILFEKKQINQQCSRGTRSGKGILSCKELKNVIYIKKKCDFKREAYRTLQISL